MAMQLGALRQALIEAGASVYAADKAAEEHSTYDARVAGLETRLTLLVGANIFLMGLAIAAAISLVSKLGQISQQLAQIASKLH